MGIPITYSVSSGTLKVNNIAVDVRQFNWLHLKEKYLPLAIMFKIFMGGECIKAIQKIPCNLYVGLTLLKRKELSLT